MGAADLTPSSLEAISPDHALRVCLCRLLVLGVSPDHPSLQPPHRVTAVKFRSHDGKNLLNTAVSGKKKAGAVFLSERDMVCTIDISDGSEITMSVCQLPSCVQALRSHSQ